MEHSEETIKFLNEAIGTNDCLKYINGEICDYCILNRLDNCFFNILRYGEKNNDLNKINDLFLIKDWVSFSLRNDGFIQKLIQQNQVKMPFFIIKILWDNIKNIMHEEYLLDKKQELMPFLLKKLIYLNDEREETIRLIKDVVEEIKLSKDHNYTKRTIHQAIGVFCLINRDINKENIVLKKLKKEQDFYNTENFLIIFDLNFKSLTNERIKTILNIFDLKTKDGLIKEIILRHPSKIKLLEILEIDMSGDEIFKLLDDSIGVDDNFLKTICLNVKNIDEIKKGLNLAYKSNKIKNININEIKNVLNKRELKLHLENVIDVNNENVNLNKI